MKTKLLLTAFLCLLLGGTYDSLYILTKENGRWGVKLRSSFAR